MNIHTHIILDFTTEERYHKNKARSTAAVLMLIGNLTRRSRRNFCFIFQTQFLPEDRLASRTVCPCGKKSPAVILRSLERVGEKIIEIGASIGRGGGARDEVFALLFKSPT